MVESIDETAAFYEEIFTQYSVDGDGTNPIK